MKPANNGPLYASGIYPKLAEVFRAHGYALAIHGSVISDFDLIAVPWCEDAADPKTVIDDVCTKLAVGWHGEQFTAKPHGRMATKLHMSFGECALDISFMPRTGGTKGE